MSLYKDFKDFAMRGNVMDMAVGIIIGAAFGKIVSSLVADILMPPLGLIIGGIDFSDLKIPLGTGADAPALKYGAFFNVVVDFLIMAVIVFGLIKVVNKLKSPNVTQKNCVECCMSIPKAARRCCHCTAQLQS